MYYQHDGGISRCFLFLVLMVVMARNTTAVNLFLPADPTQTLVQANFDLDTLTATGNYWFIGGQGISNVLVEPGGIFYFSNSGGTCTFQMQLNDGTFTKTVKVKLVQSGSDVLGSVLYAKYLTPPNLGANFDSTGSAATVAYSTTTGGGYGAIILYLGMHPLCIIFINFLCSYLVCVSLLHSIL